MNCDEVREGLPAYVREGHTSLALRRHLAECEGCREEQERYGILLGSLGGLRTAPAPPPPYLYRALVRIPRQARLTDKVIWRTGSMRGHVVRNRSAYLGGIVALAGAAGAALWRTRVRRPATA
jgi:predicted anti-sigma-YlaC factor YlaD